MRTKGRNQKSKVTVFQDGKMELLELKTIETPIPKEKKDK